MANTLSRRLWLKRSALAAAILPVSSWYDPVRAMGKYYSPQQLNSAGAIRLNLNENAYGPSEAARKAVMESLSDANRYPRQFIANLKNEIAKREGLSADHVMITAGSTELLGLAGLYFGNVITGTLGIVLLVLAVVFLLTSLVGFCPIYALLGMNTCPAKK